MTAQIRRIDAKRDSPPEPGIRVYAAVSLSLLVLVLLLGGLGLILKRHPGPLPGDSGLEVGVQHALLPHPFLAGPIEALSTLNWPKPTAITMVIIVVIFLLLRRWLDVIVAPVAAIVSSVFTFEVSKWVHRPRPSGHGVHPLQVITHTYSFPSGHVTYAVTVFGLFLFLTTQVRRPIHPALIALNRVVLVAVVVLMPVSRVLEGEHWPSDVLGGLLDGLIWLVLFAHVYNVLRKRFPGLLAADER